jgi:hypothetical protein
MRFAVGTALLAAMALGGCMGPQGNPNGQAYADGPDGMMAVKPLTAGAVMYDPYGTPAPFADMQAGQAAVNPPPPMPVPNPPRSPGRD